MQNLRKASHIPGNRFHRNNSKCIQWKLKLNVFPHHRSMNKYLKLFLVILLALSILCAALKFTFEKSNLKKKMWYLPADDLKVSNLFLINRYAVCDLKSF